jgi:hypothetical protein
VGGIKFHGEVERKEEGGVSLSSSLLTSLLRSEKSGGPKSTNKSARTTDILTQRSVSLGVFCRVGRVGIVYGRDQCRCDVQ